MALTSLRLPEGADTPDQGHQGERALHRTWAVASFSIPPPHVFFISGSPFKTSSKQAGGVKMTLPPTNWSIQANLVDPEGNFGVDLAIPQVGGNARKTNHDYTHGHLPELIDIIVRAARRQLSVLSVLRRTLGLYGDFVWARGVLNSRTRWCPARVG
jgi:hypothetical protein